MSCVEIILALCKQRKIAVSRVERDLHFGNGYFKNRKSKTIPGDRLAKVASYFAVPINLFLGDTPEAHLLWSQFSLAEAEKAFEVEKDEEKRDELANQIAGLQESIEEQRLRVALLPQEDAAPEGSAANVTGSTAEFIQLFLQSPPEIQDTIVSLLKSVKSLREAADSAPKGKSTP